ncbi:TPA: hypothetical protein RQL23_003951 [Vibrio vulnificus]|uniref:hypothetical protein n=1 Tax=Vibrio TaxID=662 RepID=UPI0028C1F3C3|nr:MULTISPECIES: hypothetical protein [Vibrio]HDY8182565.1 hypothetical protein [Vibrio vulnificus]MEA5377324.1 hypothetical protein [Vibrio parahaemolyticus]MEB5557081.1 hypothetical protein [Vibrio cholerae]HCJ7273438.1 hypothetical protein [Vibrio cholerae]HCJ7318379.1 hypothetical protein [Vibrio cholerae]
MTTKLPKLTPDEIKEWVRSIEEFYPVSVLCGLPDDAPLKDIEDAFGLERSTLMGIGEAIMERAKWNAWQSYENRINDVYE